MRRILYVAVFIIILALISVIGCRSESGGGDEVVTKLAPIHEVQGNIAESYPSQIIIYIKGGLADGCTTFHELTTERSDNTVNIKVTVQRPKEAICAQVYGYFEKNVNLGSDFTSGETYTIKVNDKMTTFKMQ